MSQPEKTGKRKRPEAESSQEEEVEEDTSPATSPTADEVETTFYKVDMQALLKSTVRANLISFLLRHKREFALNAAG
jgi:hypothetical protein